MNVCERKESLEKAFEWADKRLSLMGKSISEEQKTYLMFALTNGNTNEEPVIDESIRDEAKECLDALNHWNELEFSDALNPNHKLGNMRPMIKTKELLNKLIKV